MKFMTISFFEKLGSLWKVISCGSFKIGEDHCVLLTEKNTTKQALPVRTAHKHHSDKQWRYPPVSGPGTSHVVAVSIQLFHQRSRNPTKKKRRPHRSWKHLLWGKGLGVSSWWQQNHMAESEIPKGHHFETLTRHSHAGAQVVQKHHLSA